MSAPSVPPDAPRPTVFALFLGFLEIAICAFGGAAPWARRVLVERRRWFSEDAFLEALSLCQILPGANVGNLSVHVGTRFRGVPGALAAFTGLMAAPVLIALGLDSLYGHFSNLVAIRTGLAGVSAAAAGLVIGTAVKMAARGRGWLWFAIAVTAFLAVGGLRWPLLPVLVILAPLSVVLVWLVAVTGRGRS